MAAGPKKKIERRFLVERFDAGPLAASVVDIHQGYLESPDGTSLHVRLEKKDTLEKGSVSFRQGQGMIRDDERHVLNPVTARFLLRACRHRVWKTRFTDGPWKVDRYVGRLEGLIVAECVLKTPDEPIEPPSWLVLGREITDTVTNMHLATLASDLIEHGWCDDLQRRLLGRVPRIVLTGGPCSGKSSLLEILRTELGESVMYLPEMATIMIRQVGIIPDPADPLSMRQFQRTIATVQADFEEASASRAIRDRKRALILDRGIIDNAAYLPGGLTELEEIRGTTTAHEYGRYDAILCLSVPERDVYDASRSNNPARRESWEEASALGRAIEEVWCGHRNFRLIIADTWEEKVEAARAAVFRALGPEY